MTLQETQPYRSWVEVDLGHFAANWKAIKRLLAPGVQIMQVVKADGYGHGAIEISNAALQNGASFLGVANADEGVQLRVSGITAPIVILSPATAPEIEQIIKYKLTPSVSAWDFARELNEKAHKAELVVPVHIEVDTGMGRGGMLCKEALEAIRGIAAFPNLKIEGIFTHFSESEITSFYNNLQGKAFQDMLTRLEATGLNIPIRHIANSGAIVNYPQYNLDMVRPGLITYGIHPSPETTEKLALSPVMSFKTRVALIKNFPEGYGIGYGRTFITRKPTRIATIPVGYGDGLSWLLSNKGEALVRGKRVPIVGRISMDMCTLDISGLGDCAVGDEVLLMGKQGNETITAEEIAAKSHSISYEILCAVGKRAPRVFCRDGRPDRIEPRLRRIFIPGEERSIARIDGIIRSCFQARAKNDELGNAIYSEMFELLFGKNDRRLDLRNNFCYAVTFSEFSAAEIDKNPARKSSFKVTTHIEYTKELRNSQFMIGCAFNDEQLAALFENGLCEYRWQMNKEDDLGKDVDFTVKTVIIDNESIPLLKTATSENGFEAWFGTDDLRKKINTLARVAIEIETKQNKENRLFSAYVVYPTRGVQISFDYRGTGIKNVRDVCFFSGKNHNPEILRIPDESVTLRLPEDSWIFPTSGVTFFWDL
ncbi:MAG: alanine racemase [Syntrophobacterales bacterium]|nr:alanine racemase [Syntrophobacterales bacterium]